SRAYEVGAGTEGEGAEPPRRPSSQNAAAPIAAPTPSKVVVRIGSRFSFETVPWAVCFAVVLTALRASVDLSAIRLRYPGWLGVNPGSPTPLFPALDEVFRLGAPVRRCSRHHLVAWSYLPLVATRGRPQTVCPA